jgi:hypothetical protein
MQTRRSPGKSGAPEPADSRVVATYSVELSCLRAQLNVLQIALVVSEDSGPLESSTGYLFTLLVVDRKVLIDLVRTHGFLLPLGCSVGCSCRQPRQHYELTRDRAKCLGILIGNDRLLHGGLPDLAEIARGIQGSPQAIHGPKAQETQEGGPRPGLEKVRAKGERLFFLPASAEVSRSVPVARAGWSGAPSGWCCDR